MNMNETISDSKKRINTEKGVNVGLLIDGLKWGGGIDLVKRYAMALSSQKCNIFLILFYKDSSFLGTLNSVKNTVINVVKRILKKKVVTSSDKDIENSFKAISDKIQCIYTDKSNLKVICNERNIDILFPSIKVLSKKIRTPWIGYVYDFQHKYYPHYFTKRAICKRNHDFKSMLNKSKAIITNSFDTKKDCDLFVPNHKARIHVAPFFPVPKESWLKDRKEIISKYPIDKPYLIICNQMWVHKGHMVAIDALNVLVNEYGFDNIRLLCTGSTYDYRNPGFFDTLIKRIESYNLSDKVCFVGHIAKDEQIELVKNSVCVLQPTMFEGGPGGGIASDALALGKRIILSDISVNKEIESDLAYFFKAGDSVSLAKKIRDLLISKPKEFGYDELISMGQSNLEQFGKFLIEMFYFEIEKQRTND